jgi:hypothetical protein
MTREQWLINAIDALRPKFQPVAPLPDTLHVSMSFPSKMAVSNRRRRIGECWVQQGHILISPVLKTPFEIIDTLAHELAHAAAPVGAGHKAPFVRICKAVGLTKGRPTSVGAGPELAAELHGIIEKLGPLPHKPITALGRDKVQSTRLLKASCEECGYTIRITRKWIEEAGLPGCPACERNLELG